jgi:hypothetical protein
MPSLEDIPLGRLFTLIVLTEVAVILALYWFGHHFAA